MAKKTTDTKSKRRTKVKQMSKTEAKLTPEQAKKVRGGNTYQGETTIRSDVLNPGGLGTLQTKVQKV